MTELAEFKRGPGGRPTRAEAERRLGTLLDTAMRLFLQQGYEAVSVEEIAKQAGVAKRFIYARYGDKSELFVAAVEHNLLGRFEDTLHAIEPSRRGAERTRAGSDQDGNAAGGGGAASPFRLVRAAVS
jgi:AcrR family transcriptional regulator